MKMRHGPSAARAEGAGAENEVVQDNKYCMSKGTGQTRLLEPVWHINVNNNGDM